MGGYGSGRSSGKCLVENAFRLDIDQLIRPLIRRRGNRGGCTIKFSGHYDLDVDCEIRLGDPWDSWIRVRYCITDYWSGEDFEIDDKIFLATTRPLFGGVRWWFICPRSNRRVRMLHLPLGGRHFWSRRSYRLAYGSQSETAYDRAMRRARKLCLRLGGDPADDEYPDKPKRMRWATYQSDDG